MPFPRGAILSPRHRLAAAEPHQPAKVFPPQFVRVPKHMSMWGNNQYGDCVTAEEAFAKIADPPNVFVSEQEVIDWCRKRNYLNGAALTEVMDDMIRGGLTADGKIYGDGRYYAVDWTDRSALCDAIYQGTVKIAVAAHQVEASGAGRHNGWYGHGWHRDRNADHCVALTGYGPVGFLLESLGQPIPNYIHSTDFGYLMFTWNTIGVVDEGSLINVTEEAWLRKPTTAGFDQQPPVPDPTPTPTPPAPEKSPLLSAIMAVVMADIAAGKPINQIVADVELAVIQWVLHRRGEWPTSSSI